MNVLSTSTARANVRHDADELFQATQASKTQRNRHRMASLIASEGREFPIAIVGCFSMQESGSLRVLIRRGPLKGNAGGFDRDGRRYLLKFCNAFLVDLVRLMLESSSGFDKVICHQG